MEMDSSSLFEQLDVAAERFAETFCKDVPGATIRQGTARGEFSLGMRALQLYHRTAEQQQAFFMSAEPRFLERGGNPSTLIHAYNSTGQSLIVYRADRHTGLVIVDNDDKLPVGDSEELNPLDLDDLKFSIATGAMVKRAYNRKLTDQGIERVLGDLQDALTLVKA
jgi:hypothetical protein